ncbi:MAG: thiosulfate oxidation carrier complex protein SoxZ [Candidatus Marinarcus sp.]|uniref:thiosulfate oxidation carrier complex protein SoxZ n=1 Tax=Candidatus Marinarcus sp. TaxID=3100987 RepID=UPI003AFFC460
MANDTRIKAKTKKGVTEVKALAKHDMLSYVEAKKKKVDANFITYIVAKVGGKIVYEASTSQFLSKDPYLKFSFKGGNKDDEIEISWVDLKGNTNTSTGKIK